MTSMKNLWRMEQKHEITRSYIYQLTMLFRDNYDASSFCNCSATIFMNATLPLQFSFNYHEDDRVILNSQELRLHNCALLPSVSCQLFQHYRNVITASISITHSTAFTSYDFLNLRYRKMKNFIVPISCIICLCCLAGCVKRAKLHNYVLLGKS